MKAIIKTSREARHIESVTSVCVEIGDGYTVTIEDNETETAVTFYSPHVGVFNVELLTKAHRLDTDG